jgi:hypothetical protein
MKNVDPAFAFPDAARFFRFRPNLLYLGTRQGAGAFATIMAVTPPQAFGSYP